jgi:non-ribosomal peptide synthetase component F
MAGHFQMLLEGIVAHSDQPISTLPLLTEAERHQLLIEWNDTELDFPRDACIHELFEAQVERTPETVALEFEGEQLTYRELNTQANELAHYLRSLERPRRVPFAFVSLHMVIGLLGISCRGARVPPIRPILKNAPSHLRTPGVGLLTRKLEESAKPLRRSPAWMRLKPSTMTRIISP